MEKKTNTKNNSNHKGGKLNNSDKRSRKQNIKGYSDEDDILMPKDGFNISTKKANQLAKNLLKKNY